MGKIYSFYIAGESIKIKICENSTPLAITRVNDSEYHFPDVDLLLTSTSNSGSWTLHDVFLCVLFLSCIDLSLFAFFVLFIFLQNGFRVYLNLHGLLFKYEPMEY